MATSTTTVFPPIPRAEDRWLQTRPGERCLIRVSAQETGGAYSVVEIVSSPGDSTSMHRHRNEDEHILVLEGKVRIACGDEVVEAVAGEAVSLPKNVHHAWGNPSDVPLRILVTTTPGGIEEIFRLVAPGADVDAMALAEKFGVEIIGPRLFAAPDGTRS